MMRIKQAIVVEGRYDRNTLKQLVDAPIFETSGFGIMNNKKMLGFLRQVAAKKGLVILTDSDGAGFVIRNYLKSAIPKEHMIHAYIPDVLGKEKRKAVGGKEGKIGVEGMKPAVLLEALRRAGVEVEGETGQEVGAPITKMDLYELGYSGREDSDSKRGQLKTSLSLPEHLSANALLEALNVIFTRDEFFALECRESND